jgi:hypothetical protein
VTFGVRFCRRAGVFSSGQPGGGDHDGEAGQGGRAGQLLGQQRAETGDGADTRGYHKPIMIAGGMGNEFPAWEHRHVVIPPELWGQEVKVRFTFDTSDGAANHFHGWSVTDVVVGSPVPI